MADLLRVDELSVEFSVRRGWRRRRFRAVDRVSFAIGQGRTLGLVGESGSGKTTIGRAILGLAPVTAGSIVFDGQEISALGRAERRRLSRDIQVVFQDPYSSLNPSIAVGDLLSEPLRPAGWSPPDADRRVRELLDQVGLPSDAAGRLPHEFSGGQRQRIAIARALALSPRLIVCDEPVSALDVSTQALVLDLLLQLQWQTGVSYLFISHDLEVVRHISHDIATLYHGRLIESGPAEVVMSNPRENYTRELIMAAPVPDPDLQAQRRAARQQLKAERAASADL